MCLLNLQLDYWWWGISRENWPSLTIYYFSLSYKISLWLHSGLVAQWNTACKPVLSRKVGEGKTLCSSLVRMFSKWFKSLSPAALPNCSHASVGSSVLRRGKVLKKYWDLHLFAALWNKGSFSVLPVFCSFRPLGRSYVSHAHALVFRTGLESWSWSYSVGATCKITLLWYPTSNKKAYLMQ